MEQSVSESIVYLTHSSLDPIEENMNGLMYVLFL